MVEVSTTSVTVTVTVSYPALLAPSRALKTTMYVLLAPTSVGASKFGALKNESEVEESPALVIPNLALSSQPNIVMVADSLVVIEPTEVVFSGTLNVSADGKVGGVESAAPIENTTESVWDGALQVPPA